MVRVICYLILLLAQIKLVASDISPTNSFVYENAKFNLLSKTVALGSLNSKSYWYSHKSNFMFKVYPIRFDANQDIHAIISTYQVFNTGDNLLVEELFMSQGASVGQEIEIIGNKSLDKAIVFKISAKDNLVSVPLGSVGDNNIHIGFDESKGMFKANPTGGSKNWIKMNFATAIYSDNLYSPSRKDPVGIVESKRGQLRYGRKDPQLKTRWIYKEDPGLFVLQNRASGKFCSPDIHDHSVIYCATTSPAGSYEVYQILASGSNQFKLRNWATGRFISYRSSCSSWCLTANEGNASGGQTFTMDTYLDPSYEIKVNPITSTPTMDLKNWDIAENVKDSDLQVLNGVLTLTATNDKFSKLDMNSGKITTYSMKDNPCNNLNNSTIAKVNNVKVAIFFNDKAACFYDQSKDIAKTIDISALSGFTSWNLVYSEYKDNSIHHITYIKDGVLQLANFTLVSAQNGNYTLSLSNNVKTTLKNINVKNTYVFSGPQLYYIENDKLYSYAIYQNTPTSPVVLQTGLNPKSSFKMIGNKKEAAGRAYSIFYLIEATDLSTVNISYFENNAKIIDKVRVSTMMDNIFAIGSNISNKNKPILTLVGNTSQVPITSLNIVLPHWY